MRVGPRSIAASPATVARGCGWFCGGSTSASRPAWSVSGASAKAGGTCADARVSVSLISARSQIVPAVTCAIMGVTYLQVYLPASAHRRSSYGQPHPSTPVTPRSVTRYG